MVVQEGKDCPQLEATLVHPRHRERRRKLLKCTDSLLHAHTHTHMHTHTHTHTHTQAIYKHAKSAKIVPGVWHAIIIPAVRKNPKSGNQPLLVLPLVVWGFVCADQPYHLATSYMCVCTWTCEFMQNLIRLSFTYYSSKKKNTSPMSPTKSCIMSHSCVPLS